MNALDDWAVAVQVRPSILRVQALFGSAQAGTRPAPWPGRGGSGLSRGWPLPTSLPTQPSPVPHGGLSLEGLASMRMRPPPQWGRSPIRAFPAGVGLFGAWRGRKQLRGHFPHALWANLRVSFSHLQNQKHHPQEPPASGWRVMAQVTVSPTAYLWENKRFIL